MSTTEPADLIPDSFAATLYTMLAPLARDDFENAWALLTYVNAIGEMFQLVEDLVRDTPDGPGWSSILDVSRCPEVALPWLAQFVGVRLIPGSTVAEQRARVLSTDGFRRGTRASLVGAAAATLTGAKTVVFRERNGDRAVSPEYAYYLDVITYTDQTPDPAATLAALTAQKPGGIVLRYSTAAGQDYQSVRDAHASYAALKAAYPSYDAVRLDEPA